MDKIAMFESIINNLADIYRRKNHDYGDSFGKQFEQYGLVSSAIRLGDKYNRFVSLVDNRERLVKDETIEDTLLDLANYSIMTVIELRRERECK
jgi:hypothetical protein